MKLGLPSKGRLQADAISWFSQFRIEISRTDGGREYAGSVIGLDGIELVLLSAGEIPRELAAGRIHLGVTGTDLVREKIADPSVITPVQEMGFGHADLIVAVPKLWIDVDTMDDLDDVAARFRADHGMRLRVATKYHNLVRRYFSEHGVADYVLVDSQGATEGTIKNETAEVVADITSSGETLRANHLKILSDAPILKSQATLFASATAAWSPETRQIADELAARMSVASFTPPAQQK
ncbi:ATP phosphoribosyltransferase [Pontivivens insulae]|uniref:ATP phosphoribosyltransferase n=1 Tax=Pontivivens insulae TaxID=1639689 RepID=A0A2R8A7G8_9RHOB|nr:ATP phosphoribosyltransferase [Pontivivens insulae]RED18244.1 ATP phosphoribosyltransferase [Pontivivens insulae]SPF28142.1 ATP phosphoribosyltransferase [Pontivivens insulae]